jgi:divalent metal cation (Fe/Co/Zn/Cd) transporter
MTFRRPASDATPDTWMTYARMLAVVTVVYNVIEGLVSMGFGASDESMALFGFGADSFIEVGSALLVLWRLKAGEGCTATRLRRERKATWGIAVLFLLLAMGITVGSIAQLVTHRHPDTTLPGVIISLVSLSGMVWLWRSKQVAAAALNSQTLKGDAACSLACIQLSAVLFAGSILFVFWPALWWVDSLAALVLCGFIAKEGIQGIQAASRPDFDGGCGCH